MTTNQTNIIPGCRVMSKEGFWNLIAEVNAACGQDQDTSLVAPDQISLLYVTGRQRSNGADSSNLYTLTNAEPGW